MKLMRSHLVLVSLLIMLASTEAQSQNDNDTFNPSIWGIEVPVADVDRAVAFYTEVLGFTVVQSPGSRHRVVLDNDGLKLVFRLTDIMVKPDDAAALNLNLRVSDLDQVVRAVRKAGGSIESRDPITAAIGIFIPVRDPFGNSVHLINLTGDENDPEGLPRLYNVGLTILDMEQTEAFYTSLGFEIYSRNYLPDTLPLKPVGAAMLVLHLLAGKEANRDQAGATLLLDCENLKTAEKFIQQLRLASGPSRTLHDPSGNTIQIMKPSSILATSTAGKSASMAKSPIDGEAAIALFERFKSLEGQWMARSSKGWSERQIFEVIANQSVVMQTSEFKDNPGGTMITMYHLDGDRLMLTHYCGAGNQPRMVATSIDAAGRVRFTYLDGTNLPSRDTGHMDSAEFHFIDDDHFTDRWTWYTKGESSWMEEVANERIK